MFFVFYYWLFLVFVGRKLILNHFSVTFVQKLYSVQNFVFLQFSFFWTDSHIWGQSHGHLGNFVQSRSYIFLAEKIVAGRRWVIRWRRILRNSHFHIWLSWRPIMVFDSARFQKFLQIFSFDAVSWVFSYFIVKISLCFLSL